ncbi:exopolysaccharide biosynthesis polyprenyl glycosylphosphotransferase [Caulobacter sp. UNC279MFTsu5.1]|uniref:polysaccharide biosynthesis protein HfsE n=1 Tax=Caulobacter sp. UNC279MFTsu5.1 TaxID=1502775 RepID=UPI00039F9154|nr:exopolysaccharide biosynthesis polyprenyl glycosylphosphotransferase [Caulobacter sp. UNC279MFTsu5.1]SFK36747.1 Undecaprenyl-phosphate glucose phosphotransferase [Caulobacter sp. UNC279MFTsu5.1]
MSSAIAPRPELEDVAATDAPPAPRVVIDDDSAEGVGRRGPFRPGRLVPARARMQVRSLSRLFRVIDGLAFAGVTAAAIAIARPTPDVYAPLVLGALALLPALYMLEAYTFHRRETLGRQALRVSAALGAVGVVVVLATLVFGRGLANPALAAGWGAALAVTTAVLHLAWWRAVDHGRREGGLTPNVVVVGATVNAERFIRAALATGDVNVLGVFDDRADRSPHQVLGVPVLGDTGSLLAHRIMPYVDRVIIAVNATAQARVGQLVERLEILPNPVSLFVDLDRETQRNASLARFVDLSGAATDARRAFVKRAQDLVIGSLGLLVAAPIMLLVALAIKLDTPGPVFFRQRRHGFNNEAILVWKFRSMRHEAADAKAARQVTADDDRVTRVGKLIRKTSLDELPQLFNVLRGEMSMVGPRPHAIGMKSGDVESETLVARYAHRHRMKPGVTGWAAINGSRGPVDTAEQVQERVALDVEYIERQSFWLDLYIIAMTIPCLLGDRSAVR